MLVAEVLDRLNEVAAHVNECIRDYENTMELLRIQFMLDDCAPKLLAPARRFLKEGVLKKACFANLVT